MGRPLYTRRTSYISARAASLPVPPVVRSEWLHKDVSRNLNWTDLQTLSSLNSKWSQTFLQFIYHFIYCFSKGRTFLLTHIYDTHIFVTVHIFARSFQSKHCQVKEYEQHICIHNINKKICVVIFWNDTIYTDDKKAAQVIFFQKNLNKDKLIGRAYITYNVQTLLLLNYVRTNKSSSKTRIVQNYFTLCCIVQSTIYNMLLIIFTSSYFFFEMFPFQLEHTNSCRRPFGNVLAKTDFWMGAVSTVENCSFFS